MPSDVTHYIHMDLTIRINRIIGQLKGIQRMVGEERDCSDVLQQISAVKKAIDGLSKEIVMRDIGGLMANQDEGAQKTLAKVMERIINI